MSLRNLFRGIKKLKLDFSDGYKRPKMKDGHYRPYHHKLQRKYTHYDNDCSSHFFEGEDDELVIKDSGTNKQTYKAHNSDYYDEYKEDN